MVAVALGVASISKMQPILWNHTVYFKEEEDMGDVWYSDGMWMTMASTPVSQSSSMPQVGLQSHASTPASDETPIPPIESASRRQFPTPHIHTTPVLHGCLKLASNPMHPHQPVMRRPILLLSLLPKGSFHPHQPVMRRPLPLSLLPQDGFHMMFR